MQNMGVTLHRKDPLKKEMATYSNILTWKTSWTEELVGYSPWDRKDLYMT